MKYILFTVLLLNGAFFAKSMHKENGQTAKPGKDSDLFAMKRITCFQDVASFADRIVAYKTTDEHFGAKEGCCLTSVTANYGYIAQKPLQELDLSISNLYESGYRIAQLISYNADSKYKSLRDSKIKKTLIFMRLANSKELELIQAAIRDNKARFEYILADCNPPCGWTCPHANPDKEKMYLLIKESKEKLPQEIPSLLEKSVHAVRELLSTKKITKEGLKKLLPYELYKKL